MKQTLHTTLAFGCLAATTLLSQTVLAHGYISQPASRSQQCALGANGDCGAIQWEPQSVEGPDRFPESGPADGEIASAGIAHFSELNAQTATRWAKTTVQPGAIEIGWHFTANHRTRDFRYFLTKPGWNPNRPLERASFDPDPFCVVDGHNERPPVDATHDCYLPENRSGYHVLLGVWDVGDTANSFYQTVDIVIDGDATGPDWTDVGDINPSTDLNAGDTVRARVFDAAGEIPELAVQWTVDTPANGDSPVWPRKLAEAINAESSVLRAGALNNGAITPVPGKNDVFVATGSAITRVETEIVTDEPEPVDFDLNGVMERYDIVGGRAEVDFNLTAQQRLTISAELFDAGNNRITGAQGTLDGSLDLVLTVEDAEPGPYSLVVVAENDAGRTAQRTRTVNLVDPNAGQEYDFVFPEDLEGYAGGTRVLARDGAVYECKPFPYEGWCRVYSQASPHYEPGFGSDWEDAWIRLTP